MTSQPTDHATSRRRRALLIALLAAGTALAPLAGCGRDADEQSLNEASIRLSAMSKGPGNAVPEAVARDVYQEVIGSLEQIASGGGAQAADAALLLSEAQRGLAGHADNDAGAAHRNAQLRHAGIRAALRGWQMHSAAAEAAASYDPAPELAELDREIRARQDLAAQERQRKADIEAEIASLLGQVTERMTEASELRARAGELRLEIPRVSATEGLELTNQIRTLSRRADGLELEARALKVQSDRLNLDLRAAEVEIDKLVNQIELLGQSRAAVQARAATAEAEAARSRAEAQQAATRLAELLDTGENALSPMMDGPVAEAARNAASRYAMAARSARQALTVRRSGAQLAIGQAQQGLGTTHWKHAIGLDAYAHLLEELAQARPALPAAGEYASRAAAAREAATEAKRAAYDAFREARSAFSATGARDDTAQRLEAVSAMLDTIARSVGEGVIDAEALQQIETPDPAQPEAEPAEPVDPTGGEGGEAELRAMIEQALGAMADSRFEELDAFITPAGEAERAMLESMRPVMAASARLDRVTEQAFGDRFSQWAAEQPENAAFGEMPGMPSPTQLDEIDVDSLDIRVQGDRAVILTGDPELPQLDFRREGGSWKLVFSLSMLGDDAMEVPPEMMAQMGPMMERMAGVFDQAADRVESGELRSNQAVSAWTSTQMMQVMMQFMQEMEGGGG
jgi:hypothetical protein